MQKSKTNGITNQLGLKRSFWLLLSVTGAPSFFPKKNNPWDFYTGGLFFKYYLKISLSVTAQSTII